MVKMIIPALDEDDYVIQINQTRLPSVWRWEYIHSTLKSCWFFAVQLNSNSIFMNCHKPEWLVNVIFSVFQRNGNFPVITYGVQLRDHLAVFKSIQAFIHSWNRISIVHHEGIQTTAINAKA